MTDRDTFAAAALTGLLAEGDDGSFSEESYVRAAYRWADAMLRERTKQTAPPCVETDPAPSGTRAFHLTDAEREAVVRATDGYMAWKDDNGELEKPDVQATLATLRGLLERLK